MSASSRQPGPSSRQAASRVADMQQEQRRKDRLRTILTVGTAALVGATAVGMVAAVTFSSAGPDSSEDVKIQGATTYAITDREHVSGPVDYQTSPPVAGSHDPVWLNCGYYTTPVRNENAVHSLEHGAVWVTYRPDLPQREIDALRSKLPSTYALLTPYPDLDSPVVASAWNHQVELDGPDDPRLQQFVRAYRQGPQTPEPGALCTQGVGSPEQLG